ncbi:hypothetical protein WKI71_34410 [Streptomyces sp. MS1.AVA.1]|uniref:MFS transporter n=1 Tax=Streptomyces machairae TaxID=3134109 RepID=A0ABU8URT9_9ACTN
MLVFSLANAVAIAGLVAGALAGLPTALVAVVGAAAGATVPQIGPMARARLVALARRAGARDSTVGAALSFESTLDEVSFVLGPALVGLAAVTAHPGFALGGAAVLVAVCGSGFALHRTAVATRPGPVGASAERRPESVRTRAGRRNDAGADGPVPPHPIPAPSTPSEPPSLSRAPCSAPAKPASPPSRSDSDSRTRRGSSTPPWA